MKTFLSILRHALTFAAGLGTYIATVSPQATGAEADPRAAGLGALAAVAVRFLLSLAPMVVARGWDRTDRRDSGGLPVWLAAAGLAGFFGFSLPACAPGSGAEWPPIRATYHKDGATVTWDSAKGVLVEVIGHSSLVNGKSRQGPAVTNDK
jgi:hypothetical protein